jgi:DNA mismatch repair protein MutS
VEAHLPGGAFVPNSIECSGEGQFFIILTGPNMAGKSTFLRQVALIALMAQIGSFVPAASATIGVVDSIFCRVGATDNLARGESTFLVEMNETAHILRSATARSLIIMDEIGRGTSTRDGLAIAWAVCLYLLSKVCARTLFATHFHELTGLEHERATNLSMDVRDKDGEIVFLKRVRQGPSSNSYGIHVAKLAGLPLETLACAEAILQELNAGRGVTGAGAPTRAAGAPAMAAPAPTRAAGAPAVAAPAPTRAAGAPAVAAPAPVQQQLFTSEELVVREITGLEVDRMTPLEALAAIARWQKELTPEGSD